MLRLADAIPGGCGASFQLRATGAFYRCHPVRPGLRGDSQGYRAGQLFLPVRRCGPRTPLVVQEDRKQPSLDPIQCYNITLILVGYRFEKEKYFTVCAECISSREQQTGTD